MKVRMTYNWNGESKTYENLEHLLFGGCYTKFILPLLSVKF
jgi:hypothetical protein